jgi:hypothetical protein
MRTAVTPLPHTSSWCGALLSTGATLPLPYRKVRFNLGPTQANNLGINVYSHGRVLCCCNSCTEQITSNIRIFEYLLTACYWKRCPRSWYPRATSRQPWEWLLRTNSSTMSMPSLTKQLHTVATGWTKVRTDRHMDRSIRSHGSRHTAQSALRSTPQ